MENIVEQCLLDASEGKHLLERIVNEAGFSSGSHIAILIFPENDTDMLSAASQYLNEFLTAFFYEAALIISSINLDENCIRSSTSTPLFISHVSDNEMEKILRLSTYIEIHNTKVFSMTLPRLMCAKNLIGFKGINMDKLVYYSIYGLLGNAEGNEGINEYRC
jgi:hypothetical protein